MRLKDKVAIVTGGAHGMGASEARLFAAEGAKVIVADILETDAEMVAADIQMLVPVLDPFDGPPQSHCRDADKKIFGVELAANPEPAAGIAFLQHHRARAAAEHARHGVAVAVRYLGRAVQFQQVTGGVEASEGLPAYCAAERWKSGKRP